MTMQYSQQQGHSFEFIQSRQYYYLNRYLRDIVFYVYFEPQLLTDNKNLFYLRAVKRLNIFFNLVILYCKPQPYKKN